MNIDWQAFTFNSSETEVLLDFSKRRSIKYLRDNCYSRYVVKEIGKIRELGVTTARRRAKNWIKKHYEE